MCVIRTMVVSMHKFTNGIHDLMHNCIRLGSLPAIIEVKCQFLIYISNIDEKQENQELERRSTMENRNWSDRSTTTTPLGIAVSFHMI